MVPSVMDYVLVGSPWKTRFFWDFVYSTGRFVQAVPGEREVEAEMLLTSISG